MRGLAADAGVGSVVIVVMKQGVVGGGPLGFAGVRLHLGLCGGEGPVEPLGFPVGLRAIRLGPFALDVRAERGGEHV